MLQYFYDHDGSLVIKARLPAQVGALLMKANDKAVDDLWETEPEAVEADTPAGTPNVKFLPTRTKRADAPRGGSSVVIKQSSNCSITEAS